MVTSRNSWFYCDSLISYYIFPKRCFFASIPETLQNFANKQFWHQNSWQKKDTVIGFFGSVHSLSPRNLGHSASKPFIESSKDRDFKAFRESSIVSMSSALDYSDYAVISKSKILGAASKLAHINASVFRFSTSFNLFIDNFMERKHQTRMMSCR